MNKIRLNHMVDDQNVRHNEQKNNLKRKALIILLLFVTLIMVYVIIFGNYFGITNQSNMYVDKKIIETEHNSNEKTDDIQSLEYIKRILSDTQISTWTANDQQNPIVSSLSNGNFVVVWQSNLHNGSGWGIYGQIFYSNGDKNGNEFYASNYTALNQTNPSVASSNGKFMVIWKQSNGNIFGQIFTNDGTKLNSQFQINMISNTGLEYPSITALKNNNFVVIWDDNYNIYAQILTDNGTKIGSQLNVETGSILKYTSMASLANGNFVLSYNCFPYICAQILYSNGTLLKSNFIVNIYVINYASPSISSISNSNFMIVWHIRGKDIVGGSDWGIYGQSFTSSGVKIGNEFRVNTYIIGDQWVSSIKSLSNDSYIVTWRSNNQDGSGWGVYGQILDSSGNKIGSEFRINTYTKSDQSSQSIASLINTKFVVVWGSNGQDGNGWGIFGNIYQNDGSIVGFGACPLNCQSCDNKANCNACDPNFIIQQSGLCGCFHGFYLDNNICISNFIILN